MLSPMKLQKVAKNTLATSAEIINTTIGASDQSFCYREPISPLEEVDHDFKKRTFINVENEDAFNVAGSMAAEAPLEKVAVLNFASDQKPGGAWLEGGDGQEESLAYRSTLVQTLKKQYYPLGPLATIWSPNVVVFRRDISEGLGRFKNPDHRFVVGVASASGLKRPFLTNNGQDYRFSSDASLQRAKIRQALRVMAVNGQTHLVLGAFGCGACRNPPKRVAKAFKRILAEEEFEGRFEKITFAILDPHDEGMFRIFQRTFPPPPITRAAKAKNSILGEVLLRNGEDAADCLAQIYTEVAGVPLYDEINNISITPIIIRHSISDFDDGSIALSSPLEFRCSSNFSGSDIWSDVYTDISGASSFSSISSGMEGDDPFEQWQRPKRVSSSRGTRTLSKKALPSIPVAAPAVPPPIQEENENWV
ncbi:MAG: hypothetical protein Q9160_002562 [Pyrenula sp. 1 TL-2023]